MAEVREREARDKAAQRSYDHGRRIGRAIEMALASMEQDFDFPIMWREVEYLEESFTEAFYERLAEALEGERLDTFQYHAGLRDGSARFSALEDDAKRARGAAA